MPHHRPQLPEAEDDAGPARRDIVQAADTVSGGGRRLPRLKDLMRSRSPPVATITSKTKLWNTPAAWTAPSDRSTAKRTQVRSRATTLVLADGTAITLSHTIPSEADCRFDETNSGEGIKGRFKRFNEELVAQAPSVRIRGANCRAATRQLF